MFDLLILKLNDLHTTDAEHFKHCTFSLSLLIVAFILFITLSLSLCLSLSLSLSRARGVSFKITEHVESLSCDFAN